ncbi:MAG: PQQ-binding-like beta-propeller repeat protein [Verrucomicrobiales bacterium]
MYHCCDIKKPWVAAGAVVGALIWLIFCADAADWPQFRGPNGSAISPDPAPAPALSIKWAAELPGRGLSSPIIVGDNVFVTASSGPRQERLHLICLSAGNGEKRWERVLQATGRTMCQEKTCVAAPTPCSDGQRVFALFSSNDLFCFDLDGNLLWLRGLTLDYPNASNSLGMAASPVVVGDTLIVPSETDSESFTAGVEVNTGRNKWKIDRPKLANWTSPVVLGDAVCLQSGKGITAVAPSTGSMLWEFKKGASTIESSVAANGLLFVPSHGITVLKPGTSGPPEELWNSRQVTPGTASPVVLGDRIYVLNSAGVLAAASVSDGKSAWKLRLQGPFSGSPVAAEKFIYVVSEKGVIQVVDTTAAEGAIAGQVELKETVLCTPALAKGAIYVRSDAHLWRL